MPSSVKIFPPITLPKIFRLSLPLPWLELKLETLAKIFVRLSSTGTGDPPPKLPFRSMPKLSIVLERPDWLRICATLVLPESVACTGEVAADPKERLGHHRFWGSPPKRAGAHLPTHRPIPPAMDRAAEARFRSRGLRPFSPWQLLGAGSVGSQSLTGIPMLQHLRQHPALAHRTRVWPFETGLAAPDTRPGNAVVMAEVWPSSVDFGHDPHPVKDARQVRALAESLAAAQRAGRLRAAFQPALADDMAAAVVSEEGWVLGLG